MKKRIDFKVGDIYKKIPTNLSHTKSDYYCIVKSSKSRTLITTIPFLGDFEILDFMDNWGYHTNRMIKVGNYYGRSMNVLFGQQNLECNCGRNFALKLWFYKNFSNILKDFFTLKTLKKK